MKRKKGLQIMTSYGDGIAERTRILIDGEVPMYSFQYWIDEYSFDYTKPCWWRWEMQDMSLKNQLRLMRKYDKRFGIKSVVAGRFEV